MARPPAGTRAGGHHDHETKAHAMTNLEARIECLPTDILANVCRAMMHDFRDEADAVFAAAMKECERRMTSAEFLALCGELEAVA